MGNLKKITNLLAKKQEINKKIEDIQNKCPHFHKSVKFVQERLDSPTIVIRHICSECLLPIGYPNNKEIQNYLKH
tara:strand:+ start:312 stop:536 length:225 start_codon:yes stop_codon:yes gene_type:complete